MSQATDITALDAYDAIELALISNDGMIHESTALQMYEVSTPAHLVK